MSTAVSLRAFSRSHVKQIGQPTSRTYSDEGQTLIPSVSELSTRQIYF